MVTRKYILHKNEKSKENLKIAKKYRPTDIMIGAVCVVAFAPLILACGVIMGIAKLLDSD